MVVRHRLTMALYPLVLIHLYAISSEAGQAVGPSKGFIWRIHRTRMAAWIWTCRNTHVKWLSRDAWAGHFVNLSVNALRSDSACNRCLPLGRVLPLHSVLKISAASKPQSLLIGRADSWPSLPQLQICKQSKA